MCWELEDLYDDLCFDYVWHDYLGDEYGIANVLQSFGIEFKDHKAEIQCKNEFFELLTHWHNNKLIQPQSE
jgi:hypothetical protein